MNKEQKKKLSREKRRSQNEKRARLEKELEEINDAVDEEDIPDEEIIDKEYYGDYNSLSFSELDTALDAQKKVEKINETSRMVRDLVNNILWSPLGPDEKASAIKAVADDFGARVRSIMDSPMIKAAVEIDALELQATLARDKRNLSFSERVKDMVAGVIQKVSDESKLKDEDFAFVIEREGVRVRKYPIHNVAVIRKSIEEVTELAKDGDEDAIATMPVLHQIAKEKGIDVSMEKEGNAIQIEKDANGDWRMVSWVSNKWLDRDKEIICEDAHKEYVEWVNANPEFMPASLSWHIPETVRENHVDFMDYIDGFLVSSVKLTEKEATSLLEISKEVNLGMSHGSFVLERDPSDPRIITKYRMYEVSDLPLKNAANPFTDLETISKEVGMDKKAYLSGIMGKEKAEAYLEKIGLVKQALEAAQIESKEVTPPVEEPVVEPVVAEPNELVAEVLKKMDIDGLNEFVLKAQEAMEKIPVLEELVKELSGNQEEKLAELIDPPISKTMAWSRPSESDENVIKKNDKLVKEVPGLPEGMWLSELTGTVPIQVEETV
jgi:hypothetical protein